MQRHRWVKLRLHVYICTKCGTGKVNAQRTTGEWFVTYHRPDRTSVIATRTPLCAQGEWTIAYLAKHSEAIQRALGAR
jgi:hypothetical protein